MEDLSGTGWSLGYTKTATDYTTNNLNTAAGYVNNFTNESLTWLTNDISNVELAYVGTGGDPSK